MPQNGLIAGIALVIILVVLIPAFITSYLTTIDGAAEVGNILLVYFVGVSLSGLTAAAVYVKQNW
jgi:hypothetical protein